MSDETYGTDLPVGGNAGARLKGFVERIERMNEEAEVIKEDTKDIYTEAKAVGFDVKILRKIIKRRKMDPEKRAEEDELTEIYENSIAGLNDMLQ